MTNGSVCDTAAAALSEAERAARAYAEALEEAQRDAERAIDDARDAQQRIDRALERIEAAQTRRANAELRASAARTEIALSSLSATPSPFAEGNLAAAEGEIADAAADEAAARRDLEQARDDLGRAKRRGERAEEAAREAGAAAAGAFGGAAGAVPGESVVYSYFHKQFNPLHPQHTDYQEGRVWWDYGTGVVIGGSAQSAKYFSNHWMREAPGYWARERSWIAPHTRSTPSGGTTTVRGHYRGGQYVPSQTVPDEAARAQWAGRAKWIGRGGHVLAFGAAGLDQWVRDGGRTDLTTTDRVGRTAGAATVVGGASVAGGMAGAAAGFAGGAKAGAVIGGAIGSVIPGAGTLAGAGVGSAIGGVVGAVGGGIVGSGLAQAAAGEFQDAAADAGEYVANRVVDGFNDRVDLAVDAWDKTEGAREWASNALDDITPDIDVTPW
jgi:hypothetical protein